MPESRPSPDRRPRRGSGGITLSDVAKLAGVAPITASRALNTPSQVSPDVLERVRDAVRRTGYVPNLLAGGLASSRSRLVAAVVPTISGAVFLESVQAMTDALAEAGYQLMVGQSGYADSREDALLEQILGRRPDGIVLTGILHSAEGRRRLLSAGIPVVETWDLTPTPIDMLVGFSHDAAGASVADYLHARGRRQVTLIGADDSRAAQRLAGFVRRAREIGLASGPVPTLRVKAPTRAADGRDALARLLAEQPGTDAVFCGSDALALGALTEAGVRGLRVPDDLAVVGFGDLDFARVLQPALTTVRIDGTTIGRTAAGFIVDRVAGRDVPAKVVDVGFTLVQRASS